MPFLFLSYSRVAAIGDLLLNGSTPKRAVLPHVTACLMNSRPTVLAITGLFWIHATWAAEFPHEQAQAFIKRYCVECHAGSEPASGTRLDGETRSPTDRRSIDAWAHLHDRVALGEMPPSGSPQPTVTERERLLNLLRQPLVDADLELQRHEGRTVLRRLNRVEYEFTLRDLLALPTLEVKDGLPGDGEMAGFDTVGEALTMSYVQQEAYLRAAEVALGRAVVLYPLPPERTFSAIFAEPPPPRPDRVYPPKPDHGLILFRNSNLDPPHWMTNNVGSRFTATADGMYRLRFRARGATFDNRSQGGGNNGTLTPSDVPHVILLYAEKAPFSRWLATFDLPRDRMGELELTTFLNAGEKIRRIHASVHETGQPFGSWEKPWFGTVIGLESFEAIGPTYESWPPECHRRLFGDIPLVTLPKAELAKLKPVPGEPLRSLLLAPPDPRAAAEQLISKFVARAFRRDPPAGEVARYVAIASDLLDRQTPFSDAVLAAYQAVLCSPDFLYFQERPGKLDGEALANRLSYFLWRSLPDSELLQAGRDGALHDASKLQSHVERLLNDPRAERFIADFTDQWLRLREIEFTQPDAELYPEYSDDFELQDSLLRETRAFFGELLRHDLGVENVIDSEFVMVNRRLARLYELPEIEGTHLRKVDLPPGHIRGGLITQASVLKVTANGTTTSPVTRGVWLQDRILGSPPPPPPPDIPAIEPDLHGAITIREQLAKHRQVAECAVCHRQIDPPGFALECFDILGGYRTHYRALGVKPVDLTIRRQKVKYGLGLPVDSAGETVDGRPFQNLAEYQQLLLADKPRLVRNLVERLVTFATGAPVRFGDRPDVERIVNELQPHAYGLRSMIHAVTQSRMFQQK